MRHLSKDAELSTSGLCIRYHGNILNLLAIFSRRGESDSNITLTPRSDWIVGVIRHGAPTSSFAICNDKIGRSSVAEMETIGNTLTFGKSSKIVLITIKLDIGHSGSGVKPVGGVRVFDDRDIKIRFLNRMTSCQKNESNDGNKETI